MKTTLVAFFILGLLHRAPGQELPLLQVSENHKYIVSENGAPFFWLGDTAWELIHRLNKSEVDYYLSERAEKGFSVIQTVILAELDGINTPNAYGEKPLIDNDPCKLNEKYFDHVDYVIRKAGQLGLYVALLPAWGDKFNKGRGKGPEILHPENAEAFGRLLAKRYYAASNIIWVLGGDRNPEIPEHFETINALAKGIRDIDNRHLITFHPRGGKIASDFFNEDWLDMDMFQTGHSRTAKDYQFVIEAKTNYPLRPIINGEARYENIPNKLRPGRVWLDDADVRTSAYWSILSGAAGYSYGCNDIWQFYDDSRKPLIQARTGWKIALDLPGSMHMKYMKDFFTSIPWQQMLPAQYLILNDNPEGESYIVCAVGSNNDFIVAYTPLGHPIELDLSPLNTESVSAFWFNPRSGSIREAGIVPSSRSHAFKPWASGWGSDFILIAIDKEKKDKFSKLIDK